MKKIEKIDMENYKIIKKLIGEIHPVGETYEDSARYTNLQEMIVLVKLLLSDIKEVAEGKDRVEWSIKNAGKTADNFINDLTELNQHPKC